MTVENWIAATRLIGSLLTPAAIVLIGFWLNKRLKNFESQLEKRQRISTTRFELYREIATELNDIYAYFLFVGKWKDREPKDIIDLKRSLDTHIYAYRPLFSEEFNVEYDRFINACFKTFGEWGTDAKLRTNTARRDVAEKEKERFTEEDSSNEVHTAYQELLSRLAVDLDVLERKEETR